MVRLHIAAFAEVVSTLVTPYSVLTHMLCCCLCNGCSIIFLDIVVDLALNELYSVPALAVDDAFLVSQDFIDHLLLQLAQLFLSNQVFNLIFRHKLSAILIRTSNLRVIVVNPFFYTFLTDHMAALVKIKNFFESVVSENFFARDALKFRFLFSQLFQFLLLLNIQSLFCLFLERILSLKCLHIYIVHKVSERIFGFFLTSRHYHFLIFVQPPSFCAKRAQLVYEALLEMIVEEADGSPVVHLFRVLY